MKKRRPIVAPGWISIPVTARVNWLMSRYGMPTLYILSAIPNPFFEVAGWTAGATRFPFWKFMLSVGTGKVTRGLMLAYVGERFFVEPFERLLDVFANLLGISI